MTVAELIYRLKDYHPETLVVMERTDIGFNEIRSLSSERVLLNEDRAGNNPDYIDFYSGQAFNQSFIVVCLQTLK